MARVLPCLLFVIWLGAGVHGLVICVNAVGSLSGCSEELAQSDYPSIVVHDPGNPPLLFKLGVNVYLRPGTSADRAALAKSDGTKTVLSDPDGNLWQLTAATGFTVSDFFLSGYTEGWFATDSVVYSATTHADSNTGRTSQNSDTGRARDNAGCLADEDSGQWFYCMLVPAPPPADCPMLDEPPRCSVYLDAGRERYARLERTAGPVPCPTVDEYATWLPRAVARPRESVAVQ